MQEYDVNLDGLLDREEFAEFIRKLTADSLCSISLKLVITLVAAPALAMATKRATEGVPGVGWCARCPTRSTPRPSPWASCWCRNPPRASSDSRIEAAARRYVPAVG